MDKQRVIEIFESILRLREINYIGIDYYLELALRHIINELSGIKKCDIRGECLDPIDRLSKLHSELPFKSNTLNNMLPKQTKLAIKTAMQLLQSGELLTTVQTRDRV